MNDDGKIELVTADAHGNVVAWTPQGKLIWETHVKCLVPQDKHSCPYGKQPYMNHAHKKIRKNSGRVEVFGSGSEGDASMRLDLKLLGARIEPKKTKVVNSNKKMKQKIHKEDRTAPMRKPLHVNGQFFRSSEKISNLSKVKTPEVGVDRDPVVLPRKSNLGDSNIRGKAALDLSLNSFVDAANDQARHMGSQRGTSGRKPRRLSPPKEWNN
ncbi:hypothetical protein ACS0TY_033200 [Phlomoides rotata]